MTTIKITPLQKTSEGKNVAVKRLMPLAGLLNYDPFVLMDHFTIHPGSGFPNHPHRGFEAITYLFKGSMQHTDNLGNQSTVEAGGAQRFTAGKGLIHSEFPSETGTSEGIQLWINLPKKLKTIAPSYQQVNVHEFTIEENNSFQRKILVGDSSPLLLKTQVRYEDIHLKQHATWHLDNAKNLRGFIYLVEGKLELGEYTLNTGHAAMLNNITSLTVSALENSHFLLVLGYPHHESIHQHGPFVD